MCVDFFFFFFRCDQVGKKYSFLVQVNNYSVDVFYLFIFFKCQIFCGHFTCTYIFILQLFKNYSLTYSCCKEFFFNCQIFYGNFTCTYLYFQQLLKIIPLLIHVVRNSECVYTSTLINCNAIKSHINRIKINIHNALIYYHYYYTFFYLQTSCFVLLCNPLSLSFSLSFSLITIHISRLTAPPFSPSPP